MLSVTLYDGTPLPVIGLGTWAMGGRSYPDPSQDARALKAIRAALEIGYTHIDTAEMYASGHTEELVGQAIQGFDRSKLFLTTKVRPPNLSYQRTHASIDGSLQRLGVDTIDLFLIHWRDGTPLAETFRALNEAVRAGKIRYLGVSNFDVDEMKESQDLSETPIVTNQVPYSITTRRYVTNGVIPYCQANNIVVTAYSPVEEGRLGVQKMLAEVAATHDATPYQIAMAWLVQQPWVITIPMSHNPVHLQQNWDAANITLTPDEMAQLEAAG
ncbi:aldo/keto reductase [Candidatus Leptofilum sp.]|uniref:aldo/keto reductase n=1 Tax=Candidatus Leptofilum sp. TaxID=3241576 RepID=UPI003B5B50F8